MKTLQEILKDQDCIVHADGNIFITNEAKLQKVINEVISQRSGEAVGKIDKNGSVSIFSFYVSNIDSIESLPHGTKLYPATDPSVIDYVKTLESALKSAKYAIKGREHTGFIDAALIRPDSIKHLLD
jgi:hypothetical protein